MPPDEPFPRRFPGGQFRRLRPADLAAFQAYRGIPELARFQAWSTLTDAEALDFLTAMHRAPLFARGRWLQLGIAETPADVLVGDIGVHVSEDGQAGEVGFTLHPSAQGRGIATSAVRETLQLLFSATNVTHVLGITDALNLPSVRLLERLGFAHRESRDIVFRDEACTEEVYVLPRREVSQPWA